LVYENDVNFLNIEVRGIENVVLKWEMVALIEVKIFRKRRLGFFDLKKRPTEVLFKSKKANGFEKNCNEEQDWLQKN
jgi:hypothetical protein